MDEIIDLVFSAAEDVKKDEKLLQEVESAEESGKKFTPVNFREACIAKLQTNLKTVLVKRSAALYSSADEKTGVICLNSRKHEQGKHSKYWFVFHPHQNETITKYPQGFVAYGCGSADLLVFIPAKQFVGWLERFWTTELEDRFYWHVRIVGDKTKLTMDAKAGFKPIDVTQYLAK